jgi:hypothetical protein
MPLALMPVPVRVSFYTTVSFFSLFLVTASSISVFPIKFLWISLEMPRNEKPLARASRLDPSRDAVKGSWPVYQAPDERSLYDLDR